MGCLMLVLLVKHPYVLGGRHEHVCTCTCMHADAHSSMPGIRTHIDAVHTNMYQPAHCEQQHYASKQLIVIVHHNATRYVKRKKRQTEDQALPSGLRMRDGQSEVGHRDQGSTRDQQLQPRAHRNARK
eukprot:366336-Chlamydomonas_euryale.AAC.21